MSVAAPAADIEARDAAAIEWLLQSDEPGIRLQARRDLLGEEATDDAALILDGPWISALLDGQQGDGGFGVHPYKKWNGAHWRLVSMVELGLEGPDERAVAAAGTVLDWLTSPDHRNYMPTVKGLARRHGSIEGNALAVCSRLGMAGEERVKLLADSLVDWQWPDGGWNCDKSPSTTHSSFHESLPPIWGLAEYARVTDDRPSAVAAKRGAAFLLEHHLFRSHTSGEVGDQKWLASPYPPYWHYNFSQALTIVARAGALPDERAGEALVMLRARQKPDGSWHVAGAQYWSRSGDYVDPAGWERTGASRMLTLNALRVLRAQGA